MSLWRRSWSCPAGPTVRWCPASASVSASVSGSGSGVVSAWGAGWGGGCGVGCGGGGGVDGAVVLVRAGVGGAVAGHAVAVGGGVVAGAGLVDRRGAALEVPVVPVGVDELVHDRAVLGVGG